MCGTIGDLQAGHVVVATGVAFQLARRERVLEREVFRFGTATSVPFLSRVSRVGVPGQLSQGRPPRVEQFMGVRRILRQVEPALRAQPRAVVTAYRLEGQCRHHRIHEHGFEIDQIVSDFILLRLIVRGTHLATAGSPLGIGEQFWKVPSISAETGSRQRTHVPSAVAWTEPVASTPSSTDSSRSSTSIGAPAGTAMTSVPTGSESSISREICTIDPGRRPSSKVLNTVGERGSRWFMAPRSAGIGVSDRVTQ